MSHLRIYDEHRATPLSEHSQHNDIERILGSVGARFERWEASKPIVPGASQDEVIAAYRGDIDRLMRAEGYQSVDVVSIGPDHPDHATLRRKFLREHTHSEDEVRFFVAGAGQFSLHIGDKVYELLCETGDLIRVPAHTLHWFDMSEVPYFVAIRLFTREDGWVAEYTGDDIAERFPFMTPQRSARAA
ncbi:MAG: cupin [Rhodanobacter sp.]|jgi:1,2-dihydroxy-3-keto-5-methylthiopentene dioxygenase|nr:cupin [Rhodanobacter sp.]